MTLSTVRGNLNIFLALCAVGFAGFAQITWLRYATMEEKFNAVSEQNSTLIGLNTQQHSVILELQADRALDNQIQKLLIEQSKKIDLQTKTLKHDLAELTRSDEAIKDFLSTPLPNDVIRLLNSNENNLRTPKSGTTAAGKPNSALPSP